MGPTAKVAISSDFLSAFVGLPQVVQVKVSKFLSQFQRDPTGPGINYERINAARDPNMRSVRIDDFWRGIVLKPEQGNIFLLLWVDRHNDAYAWARRHRCAVNATTGAIQVIETVQTQESESVPVAKTLTTPRLFQSLSDSDLLLLGVPIALLPTVRALHSESDLDALQSILPAEAYEGLSGFWRSATNNWIIQSIPMIFIRRSIRLKAALVSSSWITKLNWRQC